MNTKDDNAILENITLLWKMMLFWKMTTLNILENDNAKYFGKLQRYFDSFSITISSGYPPPKKKFKLKYNKWFQIDNSFNPDRKTQTRTTVGNRKKTRKSEKNIEQSGGKTEKKRGGKLQEKQQKNKGKDTR